jgi:3-oxoacyl-[acyl-carrier protein] reductase
MNLDLTGKFALVCGSTQGIGRASAIELAALGATVTLVARNGEKLRETAAALPAPKGQAHDFIVADFAHAEGVREAVEAYLQGGRQFHILVNNTGGPPGGPAHKAGLDEFRIAFNQHLICNQILVQALLPGMAANGYGRIINVISTSVKQPLDNLGVSNTIRGAVANWAKTLAKELARMGITVNNVLPGATETERLTGIISRKATAGARSESEVAAEMLHEIPAGRFGQAEEIGAAVAWLATPAAAYVNGINLPVDGGRTGCL